MSTSGTSGASATGVVETEQIENSDGRTATAVVARSAPSASTRSGTPNLPSPPPPPLRSPEPEVQRPAKGWGLPLAVLIIGMFMSILDTSIVNVAIPVIQKQFGVSTDSIQWISTSLPRA
jgi:hypothetical protein